MTSKEKDRKLILDYIKGKGEVAVEDIINNSNAEKLRVHTILFEETMKGTVRVVREGVFGAPQVVVAVE